MTRRAANKRTGASNDIARKISVIVLFTGEYCYAIMHVLYYFFFFWKNTGHTYQLNFRKFE